MKSSKKWAGSMRAIARIATALMLAVIVVGMSVTPLLARDGRGYHGRAYHGRGYYGPRGYYGAGGYYGPGGYYYPPGYMAPPPVVYAPPLPPPGIDLVFPIHIR